MLHFCRLTFALPMTALAAVMLSSVVCLKELQWHSPVLLLLLCLPWTNQIEISIGAFTKHTHFN